MAAEQDGQKQMPHLLVKMMLAQLIRRYRKRPRSSQTNNNEPRNNRPQTLTDDVSCGYFFC